MVPVVTVVAITLMGIEGIADEIEMPFGMSSVEYHAYLTAVSGTDQCDLPLGKCFCRVRWCPTNDPPDFLDRYCAELKNEVE